MKSSVSIRWVLTVLLTVSGLLQVLKTPPHTTIARVLAFQVEAPENSREYASGQLLVKFKHRPSAELLDRYELKLGERLDHLQPNLIESQSTISLAESFIVTFDRNKEPTEVAADLISNESVEYAEPNYIYSFQVMPNDPLYPPPPNALFIDGQWGPKRIGMEAVWSEKSQTNTVIVNLDSGVDLNHPDLLPNLWRNPGEIAGNGIDDDGNGYVDDVYGWNFVDNNNDVSDHFGHGTAISGLGARGNNGIGIAGISWSCQMMTLKVGRNADGFVGDIIPALSYASTTLSRQGKKGVFNASFGGKGRSQALADAIRDTGMLFVASTGNSGNTDPTGIIYPAGYNSELPTVLSATASTYDDDDRLLNGASWLGADVAAPGAWIGTTEIGGYQHDGGTSFATPHVVHALAMMLDLTNGDPLAAKARVLKSVDVCLSLVGKVKNGGRLNVDRAYHGRFNPNSPPTATAAHSSVFTGEGQSLSFSLAASDPDGDALNVSWTFGDGSRADGMPVTHIYQNPGSYVAVATVSDGIASVNVSVNVTVTDALALGKVKLKGYNPAAGTASKLTVFATDSRQNQTPRPVLTIIGVGEMLYDDDSQSYYLAKKRVSNLPPALTIRSSLGGETTRPW